MKAKIELTPAQHAVLAYAIHHAEGRVDWFPKNILGGARIKVLEGLASRALIVQENEAWFVTSFGYETMGCAHLEPVLPDAAPEQASNVSSDSGEQALEPVTLEASPVEESDVTAAERESAPAPETPDAKPPARQGSKRANLLAVLQSPAGATLGQMMLLTGWQAHSVRGQLAHLKKAGKAITSAKENGERVYRV
jgi:hypothetical protein